MSLSHLRCRRNVFKPILSTLAFLFFRWHRRVHLYVFIVVLSLAALLSALQPFGILFNLIHLVPERPWIAPIRSHVIERQKQEQQLAYAWLDRLWKSPGNFSNLISNQTRQSRFFDSIDLQTNRSNISSYHLFDKPKQIPSLNRTATDGQIVISILYSQQDIDHQQGRFYIGQVLHHLLRHHQTRFIITLCENNNTAAKESVAIDLIRRLVPVFVVNTISSESWIDLFEREKQAHLQCILANFQSFPHVNHLLLLQDDAEPVDDDFYERLLSLIDTRFERQWPLKGSRQQPAFVKIYHPRWLIDYLHPSFYIIVQLIATSLFVTFVLFTAVTLVQSIAENSMKWTQYRLLNPNRLRWDYSEVVSHLASIQYNSIHVLSYFLLITIVLFLLNHSNVSWAWRSLHPSFYAIYRAPSCCLPGVLYFRQTYSQVIDYLNQIRCQSNYAIDTAFDDLPKKLHLGTYLVEPNLVHHIGLYSRLRQTYINPYLLD